MKLISLLLLMAAFDDPQIFKPNGRYANAEAPWQVLEEPKGSVDEPSPTPTAPVFSLEVWHADWCRYCPAAIAEATAAANDLGIELDLIDYDQNRGVLAAAGISAPPTLTIVSDGRIHERIPGGGKRADIVAKVRDWQRRWGASVTQQQAPQPSQNVTFVRDPSKRYAYWDGVRYDMETWRRMCSMNNCGMCVYLDRQQANYFSSSVPVQTEAPSPHSSSPDDVVTEALAIMKLTPNDVVAELGSGAGWPSIRMAKETGCRVVGVEKNPQKVAESRANIAAAGLADRITIIEGDVRSFDPAKHGITVVYAYLYPKLLNEIKPLLCAGRIAVCPGHKADGLNMRLVGQCWVRESGSQSKVAAR